MLIAEKLKHLNSLSFLYLYMYTCVIGTILRIQLYIGLFALNITLKCCKKCLIMGQTIHIEKRIDICLLLFQTCWLYTNTPTSNVEGVT